MASESNSLTSIMYFPMSLWPLKAVFHKIFLHPTPSFSSDRAGASQRRASRSAHARKKARKEAEKDEDEDAECTGKMFAKHLRLVCV